MSTWGEIGLRLQQTFPGLGPDLRVGYLNGAYARILDDLPWSGLNAEGVLQTTAVVESGTVTTVAGSTAIVGSGTAFTSAMVGRRFRPEGQPESYTIAAVADATNLTLDRPYEGASGSSVAYKIFQSVYQLPLAVKFVTEIRNATTGIAMTELSLRELNQAFVNRSLIGEPTHWAPAEDTSEANPPVAHQVEVYAVPLLSAGLPYSYQRAVVGFDGTNTSSAPLPWVSSEAILAKAQHAAAVDAADPRQDGYALQFSDALERMRATEARRVGGQRLQMASWLTAHRRTRGYR